MFSLAYLKDLGERTVSAFAGGVLAALGANAVDLFTIDFKQALGLGLGTALYTVLKSLAARNFGDRDSAAFLR
ncbi:holin [Lentzea flava]|uniref:holin n=1 Tax=Lentzea flava TaxID=103732 RepID=UPI001670C01E